MFMNRTDAMKHLNIGRSFLDELIKKKIINGIKREGTKRIYFDSLELDLAFERYKCFVSEKKSKSRRYEPIRRSSTKKFFDDLKKELFN